MFSFSVCALSPCFISSYSLFLFLFFLNIYFFKGCLLFFDNNCILAGCCFLVTVVLYAVLIRSLWFLFFSHLFYINFIRGKKLFYFSFDGRALVVLTKTKKKQNNQIERKKLYQNIPQFLVRIYARKSVCICNMFVFWFIRKILVAFSPLCYDLSVVCMNMKHFSDLNQQQNVIFRKSDNFFFYICTQQAKNIMNIYTLFSCFVRSFNTHRHIIKDIKQQ